jgi:MFS family permease
MWNSLHVLILPALLLNFVPDARKNSFLGLLTFAGLIIAIIVQPISGALSDRWTSRFGQRRPLIAVGTLSDLLFLGGLAWGASLPVIGLAYIGLQFTSNIAHGPAQGLLNDRVPRENMGMASGIKNFFDMAGLVISSLLVGRIYARGEHGLALGLIAVVLIAGALVTLLGVSEAPTHQPFSTEVRVSVIESLRVDFGENPAYWRLIRSRLFFLIGVYGIQGFAQYFIRDTLQVDNPVQLTGDLLATIALSLIGFSIVSGYLSDRIGRLPLHLIAALLVAIGSLCMAAARSANAILVFGSLIGVGIGFFLSANWALANDLSPKGQAGKYLGLTNLATAGASALIRLGGPPIDWLNALAPGQNLGYSALFIAAAALALLSLLPLRQLEAPLPSDDPSVSAGSGG